MQTFHFDLSTKSIAPVLNVKQGDVGRKFKAVITDGGVPYSIPAGAQFSVWFSGPSGEGNYSAIGDRSAFTVEGNSVTVEIISQMLINAGTGALCLVLNAADGSQLGLWNVIYAVEHVPGMGSKAAEGYYTALSELARQAIEAAQTFETDPSLTVAGKAADAKGVGTALAGKAPAGYGNGESIVYKSWADADDTAFENFIDTRYGSSAYNDKIIRITSLVTYPACLVSGNGGYADVQVTDNAQMVIVVGYFYCQSGTSAIAVKQKINGVWHPWEYGNPPMELGVEYRTTERWNGKVVYVKAIHMGALPNSANLDFPHGISRKRENVRYAFITNHTNRILTAYHAITDVIVGDTNVNITTNQNLTECSTDFVLWYTKH